MSIKNCEAGSETILNHRAWGKHNVIHVQLDESLYTSRFDLCVSSTGVSLQST